MYKIVNRSDKYHRLGKTFISLFVFYVSKNIAWPGLRTKKQYE